MSPSRTRRAITGALAAGALVTAGAAVATHPGAQATTPVAAKAPSTSSGHAFGLTAKGALVRFALDRPERLERIGKVTGTGGQGIVGIDVRPANGKLYAVGRGGGLFTINTKNAKATRVATLGVPLQGSSFGVDVNPAADALRIVSNTGQNVRHAFDGNTTTADGTLNVPDTTPRVRGIVGAAYTNNDDDDTTGTALFVLNSATDSIALQVPANAGTITSQGPMRKKTSFVAGFDIRSTRNDGKAIANQGYATLGGQGGYGLHSVNLLSGRTSKIGDFALKVVDLAVKHG